MELLYADNISLRMFTLGIGLRINVVAEIQSVLNRVSEDSLLDF